MTEEHHAITLDYERTVAELREASIRLTVELEKLISKARRIIENP